MDLQYRKMIEANVYDLISQTDFNHVDFNINEFKLQLKKLTGVLPGVKLKWNTSEKVNELLKASGAENHTQIIEKLEEIHISLVDADNLPYQIKFMI